MQNICVPERHDSWADAVEEAVEFSDANAEEHYRRLVAVCQLAAAILARHPERETLIEQRDPLPESSLRNLARLRRLAGRD